MRTDTRELKKEFNRQVGNIDQFTTTSTLQYLFDGGGFGFGIWFKSRTELLKREMITADPNGGPDIKTW